MRVLLVSTLISAAFFGQGLEGTYGTWKINAARSTFAGSPFKNLTVRIERHPNGEVFTLDRIEADGRTTNSSTILCLDAASGPCGRKSSRSSEPCRNAPIPAHAS